MRFHGELLKLGFNVSEPTVSRWLRPAPRSPDVGKRWLTFFCGTIARPLPQWTFSPSRPSCFGVLYCFFVIGHDRGKILRCQRGTKFLCLLDRAAECAPIRGNRFWWFAIDWIATFQPLTVWHCSQLTPIFRLWMSAWQSAHLAPTLVKTGFV